MKGAIIGALAAIVFITIASADHKWERWEPSAVATLTVGNNLDSRWHPYLEQAAKDWGKPTGGNPVRLKIAEGAGNPDCGFERGRIEICNWDLGPNGWSGASWADFDEAGNVVAMRIIINDYYFGRRATGTTRQWVICHELGHGLGLHHFPSGTHRTCMDYTKRTTVPNAHDFDVLAEMYGPTETARVSPSKEEPKAKASRRARSK